MVVALAGYGAIVLWICLRSENIAPRATRAAACAGGLVFAIGAALHVEAPLDILGVAIIGLIGAALGHALVRLLNAAALRSLWLALAHTHPSIVLAVPVLVFWWWWSAVTAHVGPELAFALAKEQADNDLNLFQPVSPLRNFEALAYGCGVGSVIMLAAGAWWVKYRPTLPASGGRGALVAPAAWVLFSAAALSLFGKGVARYLTPVWPGVAMIAAAWLIRRPDPGERSDPSRAGRWRWVRRACCWASGRHGGIPWAGSSSSTTGARAPS